MCLIGIILKGLFLDELMATSRIWFNGCALPETCMVTRTFSQQEERESFDKEDFFLKREWNEDARYNWLAKKRLKSSLTTFVLLKQLLQAIRV